MASAARGYDAAGNTTAIDDTAREFAYDATGRMSEAQRHAGDGVSLQRPWRAGASLPRHDQHLSEGRSKSMQLRLGAVEGAGAKESIEMARDGSASAGINAGIGLRFPADFNNVKQGHYGAQNRLEKNKV